MNPIRGVTSKYIFPLINRKYSTHYQHNIKAPHRVILFLTTLAFYISLLKNYIRLIFSDGLILF